MNTTPHHLIPIALLLIVAGAAEAELKVGDESAEAWKERVFKTNDCAEQAFEVGRVGGFLSGYDAARNEYASDDCLSAGECDDRADVRWIKGWQDGFSNGVQCAKYFGVRLIELVVTNYVTVTNCPDAELVNFITNGWCIPTWIRTVAVTQECKYCAWARSRPNIITNEGNRWFLNGATNDAGDVERVEK